jgi:purine-binding chemotaxis protein CheW
MLKDKLNKKKGESYQYLTFTLTSETYGLPLRKAKEIMKPPRITDVPNTREHILGLINLRGQIIPVIDLSKKLDLGKVTKTDNKKVVVINIRDMLLGLLIDETREMEEIYDDDIQQVAETKHSIREKYIKGVKNSGDELIIILDLEEMLFEDDLVVDSRGGN